MKIAVLGTGVVGGILAACLLRKGENVAVVDASLERLSQLKASGFKIHDPNQFLGGSFLVRAGSLYPALSDLRDDPPDVLFVCVKACILNKVLPSIKEICGTGTAVVSFQNGLDTEEVMAEHLGPRSVFRIVVNYAGRLADDGAVEVGFFQKPNYIGALEASAAPTAKKIAKLLTQAGLDTEYSDAIKMYVWEKVILNSSMSPLSALTRLTMADVMKVPGLAVTVEELTQEGIQVAQACGVAFPDRFFQHCMEYLNRGGRHKPSMLVDIEAGRKTEIEFLNGRICDHARRHGLAAPRNETITALIKGLERHLDGGV